MSLRDVQKQVDDWTGQFTPQYWPPFEQFARLVEEVGEVARALNHLYGRKGKKSTEMTSDLGGELADVIFTLACIANPQGIDLEKEFQKMMREKQYGRDKDRFQKK